jgi:hypothetical protein
MDSFYNVDLLRYIKSAKQIIINHSTESIQMSFDQSNCTLDILCKGIKFYVIHFPKDKSIECDDLYLESMQNNDSIKDIQRISTEVLDLLNGTFRPILLRLLELGHQIDSLSELETPNYIK